MKVASWMADAMPERRRWRLTLGIAMVVLGVLSLFSAPIAGVMSVVLLALTFLTAGGVALIGVFRSDSGVEALLMIILTAMLLFTGAGLLFDPIRALASIALLLGTLLFLSGVARIIIALFNRHGNWGMAALHGVVNLLLGVLIFAQWPLSGLVAVGLVVAIELIIVGVSWIVGGRATRDDPRERRSAHVSRRRQSGRTSKRRRSAQSSRQG